MVEAPIAAARGEFGATRRRDPWRLEIAPVVLVLGLFGISATWRAFEGAA